MQRINELQQLITAYAKAYAAADSIDDLEEDLETDLGIDLDDAIETLKSCINILTEEEA